MKSRKLLVACLLAALISSISATASSCLRNADDLPRVVKDSAQVIKALRGGTTDEQLVARAGCAVMNAGLTASDGHADVRASIYRELGVSSDSLQGLALSPLVNKVANFMIVAEANGGTARYYALYCR